jgi:protein-S-isoprenylcysteine O-methyltransferase Ste14
VPPFDHRSPAGVAVHLLYAALVIGQIVMVFTLEPLWSIGWLKWPGYVLWFGAAVLGVLPIIIFRRRGGVRRGSSYVETGKLVTDGLYAVVRHPQFLALIYLGLAGALLTPHWATIAAAVVIGAASYAAMLASDRELVEKFGDAYRKYMARVPRAALLLGLLRRIKRGGADSTDGGGTS